MATLRDQVDLRFRTIRLEVKKISGDLIPDVIAFNCSFGFSQINKQAVIRTRTRPTWAEPGEEIEAWVYINNYGTKLFAGEIAKEDWIYTPKGFEVSCTGKLGRLRSPWGGAERTYDSQDDAVIIRNLLEAHGIPPPDAHIESSGWTVAATNTLVLSENDVAWPIIEEMDKIAGYVTYERKVGIWRQRLALAPGITPTWTYIEGVNIFSARRTLDTTGIENKVVVTGLTYEGVETTAEASAPNTYLIKTRPTNPYIAGEISSDLIEDDAKAQEVATRYVSDHNRSPDGAQMTVPGNPLLDPGVSIKVTHSKMEMTNTLLLITDIHHSIEGSRYRTSFTAIGAPDSGYTVKPPIADFDLKMFKEAEDTGSGIVPFAACRVDGTKSTDPDGDETLMTFAWSISGVGGTPAPTTGTSSVLNFKLPDTTTSVTVQLTVTNSAGATHTLSKTFTVDFATMSVEDLWRVQDGLMGVSINGCVSWKEQTISSGNATCICPFVTSYQITGTSTGHVYASFDKCKTALVDLGQPNGAVAVTAVWVHETNPTRAWAATSDGKVYAGTVDIVAKTATWALKGTLPGTPPREIRESYGTYGELRATAGNGYYISHDAGVTWTSLLTSTGTAQRMAAGFDTNAVSFDTDSNPVQYESGSPPMFPVLSPVVNGIKAISMGLIDKEIYAADNQNPARTFKTDAALAVFTRMADLGQQANHMIRSNNEPGVVYAAVGDGSGTVAGVQKSIDGLANWIYALRTGTTKVHMVGVGPSHAPETVVKVELAVPTTGENAGVWHLSNGAWTRKDSGLPTGTFYSTFFEANPFNGDQWLLLVNSISSLDRYRRVSNEVLCDDSTTKCLWRSDDAGLTWTACTLTLTSANYNTLRMREVHWSTTTNGQWFACAGKSGVGGTDAATVWRGSGTASTATIITTAAQFSDGTHPMWAAAGLEDDILISQFDQDTSQYIQLKGAGTAVIALTFSSAVNAARVERAAGLFPSFYAVENGSGQTTHMMYLPDYRQGGTPYTIVLGGGVNSVAAAADGSVYCGGSVGSTGVAALRKLIDFIVLGGAASATETTLGASVLGSGETYGVVQVDRQSRKIIAARIYKSGGGITNKDFAVSENDGATFTRVTGPAAAGNASLAPIFNVITRKAAE